MTGIQMAMQSFRAKLPLFFFGFTSDRRGSNEHHLQHTLKSIKGLVLVADCCPAYCKSVATAEYLTFFAFVLWIFLSLNNSP